MGISVFRESDLLEEPVDMNVTGEMIIVPSQVFRAPDISADDMHDLMAEDEVYLRRKELIHEIRREIYASAVGGHPFHARYGDKPDIH